MWCQWARYHMRLLWPQDFRQSNFKLENFIAPRLRLQHLCGDIAVLLVSYTY